MANKNSNLKLAELTAVTPLDGRYRPKVEAKYLIELSEAGVVRKFTKKETDLLFSLFEKFNLEQAEIVKEIEKETRHDVKAVERAFRKSLDQTTLSDMIEMIHFGLTSSDINNIAFNLMLKRASEEVVIPRIKGVLNEIIKIRGFAISRPP